jgi:hypothetical protein
MATPTALPATFVAGQVLTAAQQNALRGAFRVLQVVSTAKTDTFTTTSATFTAVTGLSATITPSSTSSKILIFAMVNFSTSGSSNDSASVRLSGGNSTNFVGDANGANRVRAALYSNNRLDWGVTHSILPGTIVYLDSPATTAATTYQVEARRNTAGTFVLNKVGTDSDISQFSVTPSSITVMEISA